MSKFEAGKSGNPNGRPKGITDKRTQLKGLLDPHAHQIIEKVIELALAGDGNALKICMERLIPKARHEVVTLTLPNNGADNIQLLLDSGVAAIKAVANGEISPEQGKVITGMIANQCNTYVTHDISQRLKEAIAEFRGKN